MTDRGTIIEAVSLTHCLVISILLAIHLDWWYIPRREDYTHTETFVRRMKRIEKKESSVIARTWPIADHNERPNTCTIIRRFLSELVGMTSLPLDRNYWQAISLLFVSPGLYLNIPKTEKMLQFWGEKILDVRGRNWWYVQTITTELFKYHIYIFNIPENYVDQRDKIIPVEKLLNENTVSPITLASQWRWYPSFGPVSICFSDESYSRKRRIR